MLSYKGVVAIPATAGPATAIAAAVANVRATIVRLMRPITDHLLSSHRTRHRTALQQIKRAARECPFEILGPAEGFLAPDRQLVQLAKPRVVETQRAHELGWNFGFVRSAFRQDTDRDVLRAERSLEHRPLVA